MVPDRDGDQRQLAASWLTATIATDLDPTYRNAFGQPLMRMTFDYKDNEHKMGGHAAQTINTIAQIDESHSGSTRRRRATRFPGPWCLTQSTHNTGGHHHGHQSARQRASTNICRAGIVTTCSWSAPTSSPHNLGVPTRPEPVGRAGYWTADAIKNRVP